ncbi:MAG TPA: response regulator [Acidisphaera sp.]|nr:response regulator [Acidisphaera sp.]
MTAGPIVHVVDDDHAILESIRFMLEPAGYAVRTYDSPLTLLDAVLPLEGCVLTDFRMPEMDGIELQERLAASGIRLPVIVMTGHGDVSSAVRAMKAGAVDFLEKPFEDKDLFDAIEQAIDSNRRALAADAQASVATRHLATLTTREREVLDHVVTGKSNKEIAQILGISPRTIDVHRARIFHKLEAESLPDLVRLVMAAQAPGTSR